MDNNELLNETYQENFVKAIGIAEKYEGTETQYQDLMRLLIAFETTVKHVIDDEKPNSPETERKVLALFIDDVLSMAIKSFHDKIEQALSKSKILQKKLAGVLLPPGDTPIILGDGSQKFEEVRFHGRLKELIGLLHTNGINTDDIVVCFGERYENMMRQLSYALVEIPRLNRQILVCDQIGEATFVIDGIFSRETLLKLSKEKLQQQYPDKVRRIIYNNTKQWMEELIAAVFYEWTKEGEESSAPPQKIEPRQKIDVKKREEIVEKIKEKYTNKQFIELTAEQRKGRNFAETGLGITAIATMFDIKGTPFVNSVFFQLALKIYGEDDPIVQHSIDMQDPEKLKAQIKKTYPTSKQFIELTKKQRGGADFAGTGLGLTAIETILDVEGAPLVNSVFFQLALKIYGEDDPTVQHSIDMQNPEKLKAQIKKVYPSSKQFIALTKKQRQGANFAETGSGLETIATIFGVEDDPVDNRAISLQLAQKIYGKDDPVVQHAIDMQDPEKMKAQIKKIYTSEQFVTLTEKQRLGADFAGTGLGLQAIATIFDVKGNPADHTSVLFQLALKIYGEDDPIVQRAIDVQNKKNSVEKNPERIKDLIKTVYTMQELVTLPSRQRLGVDFAGTGLGLTAIATIFDVKGNPISSTSVLRQLAQKIYDEEIEIAPADHPSTSSG